MGKAPRAGAPQSAFEAAPGDGRCTRRVAGREVSLHEGGGPWEAAGLQPEPAGGAGP